MPKRYYKPEVLNAIQQWLAILDVKHGRDIKPWQHRNPWLVSSGGKTVVTEEGEQFFRELPTRGPMFSEVFRTLRVNSEPLPANFETLSAYIQELEQVAAAQEELIERLSGLADGIQAKRKRVKQLSGRIRRAARV